jgi:membrane protease YdiL (CAAX protease family)
LVLAAVIAAAWAVMWRTAYRLRPPLLSLRTGPRIANYLLVSWRDLASAAAAIGLVACAELWTGRNDFGRALAEAGFRLGAHNRLAVLTVLLFAACYAINLGFGLFLQAARLRSTATTVNMVPDTVAETVVFSLVLAPASGVGEEIVFRGVMQWAFLALTGDPISSVASQAVLFGIVHLYQGGLGVLRTFAIGLVLGAGTLVSGSLLPAVAAHTLINAAVATGRVSAPARAAKT